MPRNSLSNLRVANPAKNFVWLSGIFSGRSKNLQWFSGIFRGIKIQTYEVHFGTNLDLRLRIILGTEYRKNPHLRTIPEYILGSAFLPLHQDGLIEILFDKITELILAANLEGAEDKIRRFRRYLANYFKQSGPYALYRWNYYQMILDNDQIVCSTNGSEVKGYLMVPSLTRPLDFEIVLDFSFLGVILKK